MITVIGLGFVGLTTALGFSSKGLKVHGFDIDAERIKLLQDGHLPFYEPHLAEELKSNVNQTIFLHTNLSDALSKSTYVFFCVGTPNQADGRVNLNYLLKAIKEVLSHIGTAKKQQMILVIKSTVPPSTALEKIQPLLDEFEEREGIHLSLANNPEFLREGSAWEDFIHPDRIVIGSQSSPVAQRVSMLYENFGAPIFKVNLHTAEYIKYLSNALLASLISFSNDASMLAQTIGGIDIPEAFKILHLDRRWSGEPAPLATYVFPGCGFGGSCLPKDVLGLLRQGQDKGYDSALLAEILRTNDRIKDFATRSIMNIASKEDTIGILGLAFKPLTDDVRDSPSKDIIKILLDKGYKKIVAYDPMATHNFQKNFSLPIEYASSFEECIQKSNVLSILTGWKEFSNNPNMYNEKHVVDLRYILSNK